MQNRLPTVALILAAVVVGVAGCSAAQTTPRRAARLTIDGATHTTRPPRAGKTRCTGPSRFRTTTAASRR